MGIMKCNKFYTKNIIYIILYYNVKYDFEFNITFIVATKLNIHIEPQVLHKLLK